MLDPCIRTLRIGRIRLAEWRTIQRETGRRIVCIGSPNELGWYFRYLLSDIPRKLLVLYRFETFVFIRASPSSPYDCLTWLMYDLHTEPYFTIDDAKSKKTAIDDTWEGRKNWSFWLRLLSCALNTLEKSQLFRCFCWFFILVIEDLSDTFRYSNATRQLNRLNPVIPRSTNDWPISKLIVFNWWLHSVGEKDMIRFRCRSLCGLIFVAVIICQGCWDWTPGSFNSASLRPLGRIYRDSLLFLRLLDSFNTHAEVFPPRSTTIAAAEGEHKKTEGKSLKFQHKFLVLPPSLTLE